MNIPQAVLEERKLIRLYGTDLFDAYLRKLKVKYTKIYKFIEEIEYD
jgi:hypothetical protein